MRNDVGLRIEDPEAGGPKTADKVIAAIALGLLAPGILSGICILVPKLVYPGDSIPLEGPGSYVLILMFSVGVPVSLLSLPATVPGLAMAAIGIRRIGIRHPLGRAVAVVTTWALFHGAALLWFMAKVSADADASLWTLR